MSIVYGVIVQIVVLATYSAQRAYFYQTHSSVFGTQDSPIVPVETVDSYQGREKKIVIVSLVRSHRGVKENTGIGFLAVSNRICVALTRAQHGMYIIGNGAYLMNNSVLWKKIANSLDKHQLISYDIPLKCTAHANITMINSPDQFKTKSPEGGCSEICNLQKGCGHKCLRSCHPNVEYEHGLSCEYKCSRTCSNREFNHECPKRCYEDCGNCMFLVETILECGHEITTPCSRIGKAGCDRRCGKKIACGHKCVNMCGLPCTETIECQQMVEIVLECRHRKRMKCFMSTADNLNLNCVERCEKRLFLCGHQCAELCGQKCTEKCAEMVTVTLKCGHEQEVECSTNESTAHIQCESLFSMKLEPCGHTGLILCGTNPSTELCKERCKKLLSECGHICGDDCGTCFKNGEHICQQRCPKTFPCGHKCVSKCGEKCSPCKSFCSNTCEHQSCGIGENGFGRSCHELCVLCSKSCSNKCIHRSCSKRCFEECDVDTCAELCAEKLKCGHACLGMCGELCPKMCGTCERNKYLECVAELQNAKKIHPLIMLPKCHHVFPLESLDDHIKKQKEANEQLDCPKCGASISAVCRFAKYTKKRILKINMTKLREETNSTKYDVLMNHLKQIVGLVATALDSLRSNQSKEVANLLIVFRTNTFDVFRKFSSVSKAEKWRLEFACKIVQCFLAVSRLFYSSSLNNIYQKKNIPPIYGVMVLRVFGQPAFEKIIAELKVFNEDILSDVETELLGVVMPKLRFKIAKLLVLNQFIMMGNSLKNSRTDVTDADVKIIVSACSKFFAGGERQQMSESIALVEQVLLKAVPNMAHMEHFLSWKDLHVPDF
uniref:AAA_12 domain-containing protein n=2 Tax=Caenorhabditis japonica TaxID=281687 RepID=A0A8R1I8A7_CAEJA